MATEITNLANKDETPELDDKSEKVSLKTNDYFEFKDIRVKVGDKQILNGISGRLEKGKLVGILGGSGAGKTTLLNTLCGRVITEGNKQVSGQVAYEGKKHNVGNTHSIKYLSAYVTQADILCATQTVYEAIRFSALLRLPSTMTFQQKEERVSQIVSSLKLEKCKDSKIGNDAVRGISGGEKKRTSVAVELVTDSNLIFLDEPTSGLDSFTAMKTLEILKGLTESGKQVIATIHQPSTEIFELLDYLMLLANGYCVYYGPRKDVVAYFQSVGHSIPQYSNPADFVVNCVQENSDFFINAWKEHDKELEQSLRFEDYPKLKPRSPLRANIFLQLWLILRREIDIFVRDPRPSRIRFVQTGVFAVLIAILYLRLGHKQSDLQNRFGAVFFLTINSAMSGITSTIMVFPEQRLLFEKERSSNMYSTTIYVLSKSFIQIPEQAMFCLLYLLVVYWAVRFDSSFGEIFLSIFLGMSAAGSLALIFGCFAKNVSEAMQVMPVTFLPLMLFANFLVSLSQIPVWIRWIQWIDILRYIVDAICITEYRDATYSGHPYQTGKEFLKSIDVNTSNLAFDWYMAAVLYVAFRLITWIILVKRNGL